MTGLMFIFDSSLFTILINVGSFYGGWKAGEYISYLVEKKKHDEI